MLFWTSFISQFVLLERVGRQKGWIACIVILSSCEHHFKRVHENLVQHQSNNILIETKILPNYYFPDMNVCVSLDGLGLTAILISTTVPTTRVRTMVSVLMKSAGTLVSARLDSLAKIANTLWIIARYKVFSLNKIKFLHWTTNYLLFQINRMK